MFSSPFLLVHPCDKPDKAGCSDKCVKVGPKPVCKCKKGRKLAGKTTCVPGKHHSLYLITTTINFIPVKV